MKTWVKWAVTGAVIYAAVSIFDFSWLFIIIGFLVIREVWRTSKPKRPKRKLEQTRTKKKLFMEDSETFSGSTIIKPDLRTEQTSRRFAETDDLELQFLQRTVEQGYEKLLSIDAMLLDIVEPEIRSRVRLVSKEAHQLFDELFEHPQEVKNVRDLFTFYLDSLHAVVAKYRELEARRIPIQADTQKQLRMNLDLIVAKFQEQRNVLLQHEAVDFERELLVLEKVLAEQTNGGRKHDFIE